MNISSSFSYALVALLILASFDISEACKKCGLNLCNCHAGHPLKSHKPLLHHGCAPPPPYIPPQMVYAAPAPMYRPHPPMYGLAPPVYGLSPHLYRSSPACHCKLHAPLYAPPAAPLYAPAPAPLYTTPFYGLPPPFYGASPHMYPYGGGYPLKRGCLRSRYHY